MKLSEVISYVCTRRIIKINEIAKQHPLYYDSPEKLPRLYSLNSFDNTDSIHYNYINIVVYNVVCMYIYSKVKVQR